MIFLAPFLLILGLLQLLAAHKDLRGVSLTGHYRGLGYLLGGVLFGCLHQAANTPTQLTIVPGASHLALTLMPQTTNTLADWFAVHLVGRKTQNVKT